MSCVLCMKREFDIDSHVCCGERFCFEGFVNACMNADSLLSDPFFNYSISLLLVTNKMTAGAKSFGSFFTGVVNKAGAKIKETVKDNVSDFAY